MAIKVNGTTVINDSRALSNIASVDATTVAAMGAAGVGGLTTLIVDNANTGANGSSTILGPFSLADYRQQTFVFSKIRPVSGTGRLHMRLTDSSGSNLTSTSGYNYFFTGATITYNEGRDNRFIIWGREPVGSGSNDHLDTRITFDNGYESSLGTVCTWSTAHYNSGSSAASGGGLGVGGHNVIQRNQSFYIYWENGQAHASGSTYSSWGIS